MNQVNLLRDSLKKHLPWHGARLNFLALFLMALIRVRTVDLTSLSLAFRTCAKPESSYKRLQRFFANFNLDLSLIAKTIVSLMNIPQPWVLSIDRTQWCFGSTCFNIFVLGIVHKGVAFPITWTMLEKKGNSNSCERMDLLDQFWEIFPTAQVSYICGDREFIGKEWLTYLMIEPQIPFRLRIKADHKIGDGQKSLASSILFAHLRMGESQTLSGKRWVWGRQVYVSALRLEDGELLIVISNDSGKSAIADYAHRWGIETLFGMFKTRGFHLESTHFNQPERLSKLFTLMSLALCWAILIGEWLHEQIPLKIKKHGRRVKSIFRYGLDHLRMIFLDIDLKQNEFIRCLNFLSCT
ncbi:group IS10 transposase [Cyanobacterium sp. HL-69]|uniref:IS4 family transposase n=1 Tax=Cyanobacterium sp. HL-69 TaxID=2054282 RepID=UPI000CA1BA65|nr:group IS10 transposase [Cyanobacterium sp. HL-69]AUC60727.1 group IS10 transposase [Cyanobacterium sp. HL-69]